MAVRVWRGQSITEYVIVVGAIIAAITAMQLYAKRGIQAAIKAGADDIGDQVDGMRYESGERRNSVVSEGTVLTRKAAVTTASDRTIEVRLFADGGRVTQTPQDATDTAGALEGGASSISEVVRNVR